MPHAVIGSLEVELPEEAVSDCFHSGSCDADVKHWQSKLNLKLDRQAMIDALEEFGAWNDLETWDNNKLEQYIIWIAAGDIQEERNYD